MTTLKLASGEPNSLPQIRSIAGEFNAHVELRDAGNTLYFFQEKRPEHLLVGIDIIANIDLRAELTNVFGPANAPIVENFANHPKSIGELRADKTGMGRDWSPRDVLIDTLRQIDEGTIDVDFILVVRIDNTGPEQHTTNITTNAQDVFATAGALAKALALTTRDDD